METTDFGNTINHMQSPESGKDYYSIGFFVNEKGNLETEVFSRWVSFESMKPLVEIREARFVNPENMIAHWKKIKHPFLVVSNIEQLSIFYTVGGNALVESNIAAEYLGDIISPQPCRKIGLGGFERCLPTDTQLRSRAPTKKLRMKVIERDNFRCRICGRRPSDHVDIELHVHHIRPWGIGGVTAVDNLITLCSTCHNGLDPHHNIRLFELIDEGWITVEKLDQRFFSGVKRYRERVVVE